MISGVYSCFTNLIDLIGAIGGVFKCTHGGGGGFDEKTVPRDADEHETANSMALQMVLRIRPQG